jgi:DivIVA domain-containing protein
MGQLLILLAVALVAAALAWGVAVLLLGRDPGLEPAEPDGRAIPLPTARPLTESDLGLLRFDTGARGYRMAQVDQALRRAAYDIGYKEELIGVLEAEVAALRDGRLDDAETLRRAREAAQRPRTGVPVDEPEPDDAVDDDTPETVAEAGPAAPAGDVVAEDVVAEDAAPDETVEEAAVEGWVASGARSKGTPGAEPADGEK